MERLKSIRMKAMEIGDYIDKQELKGRIKGVCIMSFIFAFYVWICLMVPCPASLFNMCLCGLIFVGQIIAIIYMTWDDYRWGKEWEKKQRWIKKGKEKLRRIEQLSEHE